MRHIKTFNESAGADKDAAMDKLEDMLNEPWMKELFDDPTKKYELDSDKVHDSTGVATQVWVEVFEPKPGVLESLDIDYEKTAAPFVAWAKSNGFYSPEIMTADDSVLFAVTL